MTKRSLRQEEEHNPKQNRKKTLKYEEKLAQIDSQTNTKELWRLIGNLEGKNTTIHNENLIKNNKQAAQEFLKKNFPKNRTGLNYMYPGLPTLINTTTWKHIINKKKNTAPGHDQVSYEILKNLNETTTERIIKEANQMWRTGKLKKTFKK